LKVNLALPERHLLIVVPFLPYQPPLLLFVQINMAYCVVELSATKILECSFAIFGTPRFTTLFDAQK
jgi:hypothetical protein